MSPVVKKVRRPQEGLFEADEIQATVWDDRLRSILHARLICISIWPKYTKTIGNRMMSMARRSRGVKYGGKRKAYEDRHGTFSVLYERGKRGKLNGEWASPLLTAYFCPRSFLDDVFVTATSSTIVSKTLLVEGS